MKLGELRRLAIKKRLKIHFRLKNGMECIVNADGVAQIPSLRAIPDFNLEDELTAAGEFLVEFPPPAASRNVTRAEMAALAEDAPAVAVPHDHDDE